jgi:two-component system alkaline phosphatase synthesis response regulator PhoP
MSKKRILCVDDEDALRMTVRDVLASTGHDLDEAKDGNEAIAMIAACHYDLILLDIMMPGKSGFEVLKTISEEGMQQPVIMITGRAGFTMATESYRLGAVEYITKPFTPAYLLDTVNRILGK